MYDMHFDLLTFIYFINEKIDYNQRQFYFEKLRNYFENVDGALINFYFMSEEEMNYELCMNYKEYKDILQLLKKSIRYLNDFLKQINKVPVLYYSIEGLDYLKNIDDLVFLKSLGIRSILPVWNNDNKIGGGTKGDSGLTEYGKKLILKAVDLNFIIDLSHMNEKTFFDVITLLKNTQNKKNIKVMVSHSNVFNLRNHPRNLKDKQILALNSIGGKFGLVMYNNFILNNYMYYSKDYICSYFVNHIKYLINLGIKVDDIFISTDDMTIMGSDYNGTSLLNIENLKSELYNLLVKNFSDIDTNKIICKNAKDFFEK